jgi:hypothetical protein
VNSLRAPEKQGKHRDGGCDDFLSYCQAPTRTEFRDECRTNTRVGEFLICQNVVEAFDIAGNGFLNPSGWPRTAACERWLHRRLIGSIRRDTAESEFFDTHNWWSPVGAERTASTVTLDDEQTRLILTDLRETRPE